MLEYADPSVVLFEPSPRSRELVRLSEGVVEGEDGCCKSSFSGLEVRFILKLYF
jgi:hypothetical protein